MTEDLTGYFLINYRILQIIYIFSVKTLANSAISRRSSTSLLLIYNKQPTLGIPQQY